MAVDIVWEWHGRGSYYNPFGYDDPTFTVQGNIELAFASGAPSHRVDVVTGGWAGAGAGYQIDFTEMEQTNMLTGATRRVRRRIAPPSTLPSEPWEFQLPNGPWANFSTSGCELIRQARLTQRTAITVHEETGSYRLDLVNLGYINKGTNAPGYIRVKAGGRLPAPPVSSRSYAAAPAPSPQAPLQAATALVPTVTEGSRDRRDGGSSDSGSGSGGSNSSCGDDEGGGGGACRKGGRFKKRVDVPSLNHGEYGEALRGCEDVTDGCDGDDICAICHEDFSEDAAICLRNCMGHFMHHECILRTFRALGPKCPTCKVHYGEVKGNMPPGTMSVMRSAGMACSGYPGVGTIVITYQFSSGTQRRNDPSPGRRYSGTSRVAYLPDNNEGNEVLRLLQRAFDLDHTFVVGTSVTTGRSDTVVWNGIHHKTNLFGGPTHFGYPDSTYFARVKAELAAKGIR